MVSSARLEKLLAPYVLRTNRMTMIGFSYGEDIHECAPLEDFVLFFKTLNDLQQNGYKKHAFSRSKGNGEFPLMSTKLYRGFVPFDEIDTLKREVKIAKALFSKLDLSWFTGLIHSKDEKTDLKQRNLTDAFSRILNGIEHSIEGSIEYHQLGTPKYPVKIIVSEIPDALSMLRMREADFNQSGKPPIWTYYRDRILPRKAPII